MATYVRTQTIDHNIGERGRVALQVTSGDVGCAASPAATRAHPRNLRDPATSDAEADRIFVGVQLRVSSASGYLSVTEPEGDHPSVGRDRSPAHRAAVDYDHVSADVPDHGRAAA